MNREEALKLKPGDKLFYRSRTETIYVVVNVDSYGEVIRVNRLGGSGIITYDWSTNFSLAQYHLFNTKLENIINE